MKFMYQVPVTETYAIRSQVIMEGSVQPSPFIEGGGHLPPTDPFDPNPTTFD